MKSVQAVTPALALGMWLQAGCDLIPPRTVPAMIAAGDARACSDDATHGVLTSLIIPKLKEVPTAIKLEYSLTTLDQVVNTPKGLICSATVSASARGSDIDPFRLSYTLQPAIETSGFVVKLSALQKSQQAMTMLAFIRETELAQRSEGQTADTPSTATTSDSETITTATTPSMSPSNTESS